MTDDELITKLEWIRDEVGEENAAVLDAALARLQALETELRSIDAVMARRPALDEPTRSSSIEKAISMAARADEAERRYGAQCRVVDALRADIARLQATPACPTHGGPLVCLACEAMMGRPVSDSRIAKEAEDLAPPFTREDVQQMAEKARFWAKLHPASEQTAQMLDYLLFRLEHDERPAKQGGE